MEVSLEIRLLLPMRQILDRGDDRYSFSRDTAFSAPQISFVGIPVKMPLSIFDVPKCIRHDRTFPRQFHACFFSESDTDSLTIFIFLPTSRHD